MVTVAKWFGLGLLGVIAGFLVGWLIYALGFVLIGSAVMVFGAGFGGLLAIVWYMRRSEAF
jgi:hypothetical protein